MAKFCENCGNSLAENIKFCPKCGAATAAPELVTTVAAPAPAPMQQPMQPAYAGGYAAPQPKPQPKWLKPVLAGVLVLIVVVAAVLMLKPTSLAGKWTSLDGGTSIELTTKASMTMNETIFPFRDLGNNRVELTRGSDVTDKMTFDYYISGNFLFMCDEDEYVSVFMKAEKYPAFALRFDI